MERKEGSANGDKWKKALTWISVLGGIGVIGLLLVYAPNGKAQLKEGVPPQPAGKTSEPQKGSPDLKKLEGLEFFADEGQEHVPDETRVIYKTDPPTSGRHYAKWLPPGVYEVDKTVPELLVHNLEHGNVVIYADRDQLAKDDLESLQKLPLKYGGQWDGVVLVAKKGMATPVILTAWRSKMSLKNYDLKKIDDFLDAFRGRGPENPIR